MNHQLFFSVAALICGSLFACSPVTTEETNISPTPTSNSVSSASAPTAEAVPPDVTVSTTETEEPLARIVKGEEKTKIFNQIVNVQTELHLCEGIENLSDNFEYSEVYARETYASETQYLVKIFCFNAVYQGSYELVHANTVEAAFYVIEEEAWAFTKDDVVLAGYPTFDPATSILANRYKLDSAGSCVESTRHYWDGRSLELISATFVDGVANGCADLGVGVGSPTN